MLAIYGGKPVRDTYLPYGHQSINEEDIKVVTDALRGEYLTTGQKVAEFENKVKEIYKKHAIAVNSGTSALHCAVHACNLSSTDEVIVTCISFVASANCILYENAKPIFCDVQQDTLNIDPDKIESLITKNTKAIITVDYGGQLCDYEKILPIVKKHNLILIEDACHALGTKTCPESDFTIFSFHPVKHITTCEGGMVLTNNEIYYEIMKSFRTHGIIKDHNKKHSFEMYDLGFNYRIPDLNCSLGISQLKRLDSFVKRRKEIAKIYDEKLVEFKDDLIPLTCRNENSYHLYVIKILHLERDTIFNSLQEENIGVNLHYIPIYLNHYYQERFHYPTNMCPNAEQVYKQILTLPLYPDMSSKDIDDVINAIRKVINFYSVSIVKVEKTEENAKLIHEWRNDEVTRKMSFNTNIIEYSDFVDTFNNKYFSNDIPPLFIMLNDIKIGFVGCVKRDDKYIIGINLSPQYRNKGYGTIGLMKSLMFIKDNYKFPFKIIAEIKDFNLNSIKMFEKCNFKFIDREIINRENILIYEFTNMYSNIF